MNLTHGDLKNGKPLTIRGMYELAYPQVADWIREKEGVQRTKQDTEEEAKQIFQQAIIILLTTAQQMEHKKDDDKICTHWLTNYLFILTKLLWLKKNGSLTDLVD